MLYKFNTNFGYYSIDFTQKNYRVDKVNNFFLFDSRNILNKIQNKKFYNVIPYIERIDFTSSSFYALCFIKAIEEKNNIEEKDNVKTIRSILLELEKINCHLISLRNLYYITKDLVLINISTEIIEAIFSYFETITGHRIYHNFFTLGGFNQNFTIGNFEKTISIVSFISKRIKYFLDIAIELPSIKTRLENFASVFIEESNEKICAYKRYVKIATELEGSINFLKELLVSDLTFNVSELKNFDSIPDTNYSYVIKSPRGDLTFSFSSSKDNLIQNLKIDDPSTAIFRAMTNNLNKILIDDINLAVNSFFISFLEIVK